MDTPRMLSGEELVNRGVTKSFATLPEIGLKDVQPNGSWLEQKQIQAALEARKQLIEVERIEKFGILSQAEWRDDLKLAEVTKQTGGHWHYFGHNVGKKLYITCEEALFLIEVNCLLLKHNGVTVSLQKAYSLLLDDKFTINHYKVYASLSKLGYKVFRHNEIIPVSEKGNSSELKAMKKSYNSTNKEIVITTNNNDGSSINPEKNNESIQENKTVKTWSKQDIPLDRIILDSGGDTHINVESEGLNAKETRPKQNAMDIDDSSTRNTPKACVNGKSSTGENSKNMSQSDSGEANTNLNAPENHTAERSSRNVGNTENSEHSSTEKVEANYLKVLKYETKLKKLESRNLKCTRNIHNNFGEIPDMSKTSMVYINVPEECHIPRNIFVNKTTYLVNLEIIRSRNPNPTPSSAESSCLSSDESDHSLRRLSDSSRHNTPRNTIMPSYDPHTRLPRINQQFRPFFFWRPRPHFNFTNFNMFNARLPNQLHPRYNLNIRPNPFLRPFPNVNILDSNNSDVFPKPQKRTKYARKGHLKAVKSLATKVKNHILSGNMVMPGNTHIQTIQALHKLLYTYNLKYNTRLRLTPQFDLVGEPNVVETIELDCDEEIQSKRPRLEEDTFHENFTKLRQIALKLRNLEVKGISTSRHRRALSAAIKTFNKSYNADVSLQDNYDIVDRRHITLDSSSESDSEVNENKKRQKNKKLRNPFNILKRLSETHNNGHASTSKGPCPPKQNHNIITTSHDDQLVLDNWAHWVPKDKEFGKIERCLKNDANICTITQHEDLLLFDFLKSHPKTFDNWIDIKVEFTKYLKELSTQYEMEREKIQSMTFENLTGLCSIIKPDDCSDMPTLLKKLRIIKNDNSWNAETSIKIDFDVYNRDVQNFRKTNRPKPHFRIVCFDCSSTFPNGSDIAGLHAKHNDGVPTVFAVVDMASVSYLQINPSDLPVHILTNLE